MRGWKSLENDLTTWLEAFARDDLEYRNPNQAIIGFPADGFRSDGMLTDGQVLLAIEVEAAQMHPDTNVGKYWLLAEKYEAYDRILLFHIYTPDFDSYPWRMELGRFYASKMKETAPFEYKLMDYRNAEDYAATLSEIKSAIEPALQSAFDDLIK